MAEDTEEPRPEDEEVQGGAVKSFLEHLEDLRWTLVKCSAVTLVTMGICLFAIHHLVAFLKWPLDRASLTNVTTNQMVTVRFGNTVLGTYNLGTNRVGTLELGTNKNVTVQLEPVLSGEQTLITARVLPVEENAKPKGLDLVYLDPASPFLSSLHLAFFGGLFLASPFVLYYIGQFLMPALKIKEKKYFLRAFYIGAGLFLIGVTVAYYWIMPRALQFAVVYAEWMGVSVPEWRAETYFSFVLKFMLGMGLGFELPVILLALVKIGILDYAKLKAMRRYVIVANTILGALLTTPEVFTQVVMAIILQVLFEISVWIAWYWERQEKKKNAAAGVIETD